MNKFIELNFGQTTEVQREIVPTDAIKDVYIDLPNKRNIVFRFEHPGGSFKFIEYYKDISSCTRRWMEIRDILGLGLYKGNYTPLPMDAEDCPDYVEEIKAIEKMIEDSKCCD